MTALDRLAALYGVARNFTDTTGRPVRVRDGTLVALLAALGIRAETEAEIVAAAEMREAERAARLLPPWIVARRGCGEMAMAAAAEWRLVEEDGGAHEGRAEGRVEFDGLRVGVHRLTARAAGREDVCVVIVPPERAPSVGDLAGVPRVWGFAAPLYGLRSDSNLGVGTYSDLAALGEALAARGASYLAINPVHALFPAAPEEYSPYSPSHRGFLNTAHIDPFSAPEAAATALPPADAAELAALRAAAFVDHTATARALAPMFDALFAAFEALGDGHPRRRAFAAWRTERVDDLDRLGLYEAIAERCGAHWTGWPAPLRDPGSEAVAAFAAEHGARARRAVYLQWLAETQLAEAQRRARAAGMPIGLMLDLAVGVRPDGAETWARPGLYAAGATQGAPPDAFNPNGQDWTLAPLNPHAMEADGFAAFRSMLRTSMRLGGALRIDHVAGFARGFWVAGATGEGSYVAMPRDALLALVALEAERNRCLVVGEDLGNVPFGLREEMEESGLYGCRLVYFDRTHDGSFRPPADYPERTMASVGSHDLATLAEWWRGTDIDEREALGLISADHAAGERQRRAEDRRSLSRLAGLTDMEAPADEVIVGVHAALAAAGSALVTVQAENVTAAGARLNLPGTIDTYPNWRRRLPEADELLGSPLFLRVAEALAAISTRVSPPAPS